MSERLDTENSFNVLADVWETLRLKGSIFFRSELGPPWGIALPQQGIPRFHVCLKGSFYAGSTNTNAVRARPGQIVLIPRGGAHWIADNPERKKVPSVLAGDACELNNPLFQTEPLTDSIMCGLTQFDYQLPHPIFSSLPEIILFDWLTEDSTLWQTARILNTEIERSGSRQGPIVDRLTEVLMLQLVEEYQRHVGEVEGFLGALNDRRVHRALQLIHSEIEKDWTLSSLGESVGMSRTTLVRQFQEEVGEAPMAYIASWRLTKAFNLAKNTTLAFDDIAEKVGFASARTLNRAFKRHFGFSPKELRLGKDK